MEIARHITLGLCRYCSLPWWAIFYRCAEEILHAIGVPETSRIGRQFGQRLERCVYKHPNTDPDSLWSQLSDCITKLKLLNEHHQWLICRLISGCAETSYGRVIDNTFVCGRIRRLLYRLSSLHILIENVLQCFLLLP